jgi:tripartite-type tricarboxylate transporter receptor subunit TctC
MHPAAPVRLVVPFGRDGASDWLARRVAAGLAQRWGHEVTVDNLPGDGAVAGMREAARAAPDGHTLLFGTSTTHAIAPALRRDLGLDPAAAFVPLALVGWAPNLLLVRSGLASSVTDLVALAHRAPQRLRYASAGHGQTIHLCAALFAQRAGIELEHVPFPDGSIGGLRALAAGRVDLMFDNVLASLPALRNGEVDVLAVAGAFASSALPGVPTLEDAGVADAAADIWMGLFAPVGTPAAVCAQIARDIGAVLGQTDLVAELSAAGFMLDIRFGDECADEIAANAAQWRDIVAVCRLP